MKILILIYLFTSFARAADQSVQIISLPEKSLNHFNLASLPGSTDVIGSECLEVAKTPKAILSLTSLVQDDRFWSKQKNGDVFIKIVRKKPFQKEYLTTLGLTNKEALTASRDLTSDSVFTPQHVQGDLANRWGHSVIYRIPAEIAKNLGASQIVSTLLGLFASLPKEYLYDRHPSASDIPVTYSDKLGTKSSEFEFTVFGDSLYGHRPFEGHVEIFKGSAPFVTWRKKFK